MEPALHIHILNCVVYLARKERWHAIKIRALVMTQIKFYYGKGRFILTTVWIACEPSTLENFNDNSDQQNCKSWRNHRVDNTSQDPPFPIAYCPHPRIFYKIPLLIALCFDVYCQIIQIRVVPLSLLRCKCEVTVGR